MKKKTTVELNCSNLGFGPIQTGYVRKIAENLLLILVAQLNQKKKSAPTQKDGLAGPIERLADMKKSLLTDEEFAAAKAKLL
ncbi:MULTISPECIES: hypothetical protein [unclassified Synechococcus]|uniref:hypothetical protein n=1 Tax=unclassified Synechococcus TaxID=2626047 RepID=UPI0039AEE3E0